MSIEIRLWLLCLVMSMAPLANAQQAAATGEPLSVQTVNLPKASLQRQYRHQLEAQGGIHPLKWQVSSGQLPPGVLLTEAGSLNGIPTQRGEFRFVATVSDSGKPAHQRNQELVLRVVAPLLAEWSRYPKIVGQRVEGAIKVSNETENDFDLTVIMLAVNEIGRATAVGYERFTLKKDTSELEIPFAENLPSGTYELHVDVVAEVPSSNAIYRARLVPKEKLQVQQGP
jgi:hypothetical protein